MGPGAKVVGSETPRGLGTVGLASYGLLGMCLALCGLALYVFVYVSCLFGSAVLRYVCVCVSLGLLVCVVVCLLACSLARSLARLLTWFVVLFCVCVC